MSEPKKCPACGYEISPEIDRLREENRKPNNLDVTVCVNCTAVLLFGEGGVREALPADLESMSENQQAAIASGRRMIRDHNEGRCGCGKEGPLDKIGIAPGIRTVAPDGGLDALVALVRAVADVVPVTRASTAAKCPACGNAPGGVVTAGRTREPQAGDYYVCGGCAELLRFTTDMELREARPVDTDSLSTVELAKMRRSQQLVRERISRSRPRGDAGVES